MPFSFPILQAGNEENIGKLVFPIILLIIWIISSVMSAANKHKQRQRRMRMEAEAARMGGGGQPSQAPPPLPGVILRELPLPPRPMPAPQPSQRRTPLPPPRTPQQVRKVPQPKPPKKKKSVTRPPVMVMEAPAERTLRPAPAMAPAVPVAATKATAATAQSINRWLSPATLRQQFILTEILRPPKALREDEGM